MKLITAIKKNDYGDSSTQITATPKNFSGQVQEPQITPFDYAQGKQIKK